MNNIFTGDAANIIHTRLSSKSVQSVITSPPYYHQRTYGTDNQIGLEPSPGKYIEALMRVFEATYEVLRDDGVLVVVIDDSYAGGGKAGGMKNNADWKGYHKATEWWNDPSDGVPHKSLIGIPERFVIAMLDAGWILRSKIIWHKPNCLPSSANDRRTHAYENIYLFAKQSNYFVASPIVLKADGITRKHDRTVYKGLLERANYNGRQTIGLLIPKKQKYHKSENFGRSAQGHERSDTKCWPTVIDGIPRRQKRDVEPYRRDNSTYAHDATFPESIPMDFIKTYTKPGDTVLDPFSGIGTTGMAAVKSGRHYIGIDCNAEYNRIARERIQAEAGLFVED